MKIVTSMIHMTCNINKTKLGELDSCQKSSVARNMTGYSTTGRVEYGEQE